MVPRRARMPSSSHAMHFELDYPHAHPCRSNASPHHIEYDPVSFLSAGDRAVTQTFRTFLILTALGTAACAYPNLSVRNDSGRDSSSRDSGTCGDIESDPDNCGECGNQCPRGPHSVPVCNGGQCSIRCESGFGNCDGNPYNGCEADFARDPSHCGNCATECAGRLNAMPVCQNGSCSVACISPYADCNSNLSDGCEARIDQPMSCGTCTNNCNPMTMPYCSANSTGTGFECTSGCDVGETLCSGSCVDTDTSPTHCGMCGNACVGPDSHGRAVCNLGECGIECDMGYHVCPGRGGPRCLDDTSPLSCGTSCEPCLTPANSSATCNTGVCGFACNPGWGDCNRNPADGCEQPLNSTTHCGRCFNTCASGQYCCFDNDTGRGYCSTTRCLAT